MVEILLIKGYNSKKLKAQKRNPFYTQKKLYFITIFYGNIVQTFGPHACYFTL